MVPGTEGTGNWGHLHSSACVSYLSSWISVSPSVPGTTHTAGLPLAFRKNSPLPSKSVVARRKDGAAHARQTYWLCVSVRSQKSLLPATREQKLRAITFLFILIKLLKGSDDCPITHLCLLMRIGAGGTGTGLPFACRRIHLPGATN